MSIREDLLAMMLDGGGGEYSELTVTKNGIYRAADFKDVEAWDVVRVNVRLKVETFIDPETGEEETVEIPEMEEEETTKKYKYVLQSIGRGPKNTWYTDYYSMLGTWHKYNNDKELVSESSWTSWVDTPYTFQNGKFKIVSKEYVPLKNGRIGCHIVVHMTGYNSQSGASVVYDRDCYYYYRLFETDSLDGYNWWDNPPWKDEDIL